MLDARQREIVRTLWEQGRLSRWELHQRTGLTVLMVSHALNEVANYVHRIGLVFEGRFRIGDVAEIISEEVLREVYGLPVEVSSFEGHRVVVARPSMWKGFNRSA